MLFKVVIFLCIISVFSKGHRECDISASQLIFVRKLVNRLFPSSVMTLVLYRTHSKWWDSSKTDSISKTEWSVSMSLSEESGGAILVEMISLLRLHTILSKAAFSRVGGQSISRIDGMAVVIESVDRRLKSPATQNTGILFSFVLMLLMSSIISSKSSFFLIVDINALMYLSLIHI